jgi:hypothetical protein
MKKGTLLLILTIFAFRAFAQKQQSFKTEISGQVVTAMITEAGDTIIVAELKDVSIVSIKKFKSSKERRHYLRMKYHANQVYPYAVEAVRVFRELEAATKDLKRRNRKKQIKRLQKELEDKFKSPLKKLTRTQGRILIKMIERELDSPMYEIVKELKGGFTAGYWNTFGKIYDIDIKQGYNAKDDSILESILSGMDISHKVAGN